MAEIQVMRDVVDKVCWIGFIVSLLKVRKSCMYWQIHCYVWNSSALTCFQLKLEIDINLSEELKVMIMILKIIYLAIEMLQTLFLSLSGTVKKVLPKI